MVGPCSFLPGIRLACNLLLGTFVLGQDTPASPLPQYDLVLRGGRLVDGRSRTIASADLALRGNRIEAIGKDLPFGPGTAVLDLHGLCVAPGFIDLHTHVDSDIVREPLCQNFLRMGVTTLITGNCGGSVPDLGAHFTRLEKGGIGPNYGSLIGLGTVRTAVLGTENRAPTEAEQQRMRDLIENGMRAGAYGVSTGLIYVPGTYATRDELADLAAVAGRFGGLYASHVRYEGDQVLDAMREALYIGEHGHLPVHISHIKCTGKPNHGRAQEVIALLLQARAHGQRVSADQYTYDASSTGLDVLFPSEALAIGREQFGKRLREDPAFRTEMHAALLKKMDFVGFGDFRYARIASAKGHPEVNGMLIPEAAEKLLQRSDRDAQAETAIELFASAAPARVTMVYHTMAEQDVERYLQEDWIAVASDAGIRAEVSADKPHPRGCGNNPRLLGRYVRDRNVIDLPLAIHKMTSLPAELFGLTDRGELRTGAFADLVVFDPATIQDEATYADPLLPPKGIAFVFVNGRLAVHDGKTTGVRAGVVLRHTAVEKR
jgi:N-acyl-D-amino-acid deacylase